MSDPIGRSMMHFGFRGLITLNQGAELLMRFMGKEDWAKIEKAGLAKIRFSWAGSTKPFEPHYYRIQGPTFLLEYANTQNGSNHIHATWRDFPGDFGRDILREHVKKAH